MGLAKNRPFNTLDSQGRPIFDSVDETAMQMEYDASNLIYKGTARPGADVSEPVWQIFKMGYDGAGNPTSITWPQNSYGKASTQYEFVWDDRTTYTYS